VTQKTARKKLLMMRNGTPPDVGPPLHRGAYGVRSPRPHNGHLLAPSVDQLAHLSGTELQGCSWGASRDSGGRAAAQPPCARTRSKKVAWRRRSGVQLAAPRCPRRPPAWPCHPSRRQKKQQRKSGSYSALPVATTWPPCRRRHPWRHLFGRRAQPCCRHMKNNMILNQPGAWSAEPSGLLPGPWNHRSIVPRVLLLVLGEARKSWRCPMGSADHSQSSRLMVRMDAAPVSTAAVASSRPREGVKAAPWHGSRRGGTTSKDN
jgi:hypothetical protein